MTWPRAGDDDVATSARYAQQVRHAALIHVSVYVAHEGGGMNALPVDYLTGVYGGRWPADPQYVSGRGNLFYLCFCTPGGGAWATPYLCTF